MNRDSEQTSQGTEQKRQGREQNSQGADITNILISIAKIEGTVEDISNDVSEVKTSTAKLIDKLDTMGNRVTKNETKLSTLAVFQTAFSVVTGAIASYLGVKG